MSQSTLLRFTLPAAALLVLGACASSGGGAAARLPTTGTFVEDRDVRSTTVSVDMVIPAAPADTWNALQAVYAELGLEVTANDPARRTLASRGQRMRRLGGERNSTWVDCGRDVTGPVADRAFVDMDVVSVIQQASADQSQLVVQVQARGQRRDGGSGGLVCSSRNELELRIRDMILERVGA